MDMKVEYRLKRISMEDKVKVITDYNGGIPVNDILKKYDISRMTMYRILREEAKRQVEEGEVQNAN